MPINKILVIGITISFLVLCFTPSVAINNIKITSSLVRNDNTFYNKENASFILLNSTYEGGSYDGVWGDGTYIYVACGPDGIRAYSYDGNSLTLKGHRDDGGGYSDVWSDGTYIYVACYLEGIKVYSFDGNNFTLLDNHKEDGGEYDRYFRIWGDGSYVYVVCLAGGIRAYSFDGNNLFMKAHRTDGGSYQGIGGDGNYIFAGCKSSGIRAYSFNGENFSLLDTYSDDGNYYEIWCQNGYIFCSVWSDGVYSFIFDDNNFSFLSNHFYGGYYMGCWGDGKYVFITSKYEGIMAYSFDGEIIYNKGKRNDGGWYFTVWGDGTNIYAACQDDGLRVYRFIDDTKVFYVGGDGSSNYSRIQDAIDNASNGDTIFVYNDSSPYYENIRINKSIYLFGEDKDNTIIFGNGNQNVISIISNGALISGFKIQNNRSNYFKSGIRVYSNYNSIIKNIILNNSDGINLSNSKSNFIKNNLINSNKINGIYLKNSNSNKIIFNSILKNQNGINLSNSDYCKILENNIDSNKDVGICLNNYSDSNRITNNKIEKNIAGMYFIHNSKSNTINNNIVILNEKGIFIDDIYSTYNRMFQNNFAINGQNAFSKGFSNYWDDGSSGNFWDDYNGTDNNGDGIGDTPYPIAGGENEDRYPLMEPYGNNPPNIPTINGPTSGKPNTEYDFIFDTTDPNDDAVMYIIDWGDNNTEWTEYSDSGEEITIKHIWKTEGNFTIKAQAIDIYDAESDWAEFEVEIPRGRIMFNILFLRLFERFPLLERLLNLLN